MQLKSGILIILCLLLLTGCRYRIIEGVHIEEQNVGSTEAATTESYLNEAGLYEKDGHTYKYRIQLDGVMHKSNLRTSFVLLSNTRNITFDDVEAHFASSDIDSFIKAETAVIVSISTYEYSINEGTYVDYDNGTFASIQLFDDHIIYKDSMYSTEENVFNYALKDNTIYAWNVYNDKTIKIIDRLTLEYRGAKYTFQEDFEPVTEVADKETEFEINPTGYIQYDELIKTMLRTYYADSTDFEVYEAADVSPAFGKDGMDEWGCYALYDIDGDGIHELFLGRDVEYPVAYNIFTIKDNELIKVIQCEGSVGIFPRDNGVIYFYYLMGIGVWEQNYYQYENGEAKLIESLWHDNTEPEDYSYHYATGGMGENEAMLITEEKAEAIMSKYGKVEINYTPFIKSVVQ